MKVALLLSGKFRDSFDCHTELTQKLLKKYNVDVFISYFYEDAYDVDISMQELVELYKPKSIIYERIPNDVKTKIKSFNKFLKYTEVINYNFALMWYGIHSVNQLKQKFEIHNKFRYDVVIKTRFDLKLLEDLELKNRKNAIHIPIGWDHRGGYNDLFAYGDSESMDYYCDLFNKIETYYSEQNRIHPEKYLRTHLEKSKRIMVYRIPLKNSLRGMVTNELEYRTT